LEGGRKSGGIIAFLVTGHANGQKIRNQLTKIVAHTRSPRPNTGNQGGNLRGEGPLEVPTKEEAWHIPTWQVKKVFARSRGARGSIRRRQEVRGPRPAQRLGQIVGTKGKKNETLKVKRFSSTGNREEGEKRVEFEV